MQRFIYVAADSNCAACVLRTSCLSQSASGKRGRRVSARRRRVPPLTTTSSALGAEAIRWNDVAGRRLRRTWMTHWRSQTVTIVPLLLVAQPPPRPPRAERAHRRLSWEERWRRNVRGPLPLAAISLAGIPQQMEMTLTALGGIGCSWRCFWHSGGSRIWQQPACIMASGIGLIGMIGVTKASSAWDGSVCWTSCDGEGYGSPAQMLTLSSAGHHLALCCPLLRLLCPG